MSILRIKEQTDQLRKQGLTLDQDTQAIPFSAVKEAIQYMRAAKPKSTILPCKVIFELLFLSGMRLQEINNCQITGLWGNTLYFHLGKNQTGTRKTILPDWYLYELKEYRDTCRVRGNQLFGITAKTFRRYFNRDIRPFLSPEWRLKQIRPGKTGCLRKVFVYALKGARKNYQTLLFNRKYREFNDASFALEWTSKEMKHSSARLTCYHYIQNFETLKISKFSPLNMEGILHEAYEQKHLIEYGVN